MRVLLTTGPTREPIDPVRFLSNYSTGYMGARLAAEAIRRGHRVTVIAGPGGEPMPPRARVIPVERTTEMGRVLRAEAPRADAVIMAAAVADFQAARPARAKRSRQGRLVLRLRATPDLISGLPRRKGQIRVGFALEGQAVVARARRKLQEKHLDLLLAQHLHGHGSPFGRHAVRAWLLEPGRAATALGRIPKSAAARLLLDKVEALWYGQRRSRTASRRAHHCS